MILRCTLLLIKIYILREHLNHYFATISTCKLQTLQWQMGFSSEWISVKIKMASDKSCQHRLAWRNLFNKRKNSASQESVLDEWVAAARLFTPPVRTQHHHYLTWRFARSFTNKNLKLHCCWKGCCIPLTGSQGWCAVSPSLLSQSCPSSLPSQSYLPTLLSENESSIGKRFGNSDSSRKKPSALPQLPGW